MIFQNSVDGADEADTSRAPEFQILILSENPQVLSRAMPVCNYLVTRFEGSFVYRIAIATFAALEKPGQYQESLRVARTADMLFVVSDVALPATPRGWLQACVCGHEDAAFAIADMTKHGIANADALLAGRTSRRGGVELIRPPSRWTLSGAPAGAAPRLRSGDGSNRWGLNE